MDLKADLQATRDKLRGRMADLRSDIETVKAPAVPIYKEMDALIVEHNRLGARIRELTDQANALEQPRLHALKMELGQVARTEDAIRRQIAAMG